MVTRITACRLCGSPDLWEFFTLGDQPLANDLVSADRLAGVDERFPLTLVRCDECGHVQLLHTVSPDRLFSDYRFQSGIAPGWHQHCTEFAQAQTLRRLEPGFVVDVGSNDGTLLTKFQAQGWTVLGIEPAANLARTAPVPTIHGALTAQLAHWVRESHGPADLVIAQNVLGHVGDPTDFLCGAKVLLAPAGTLVIEVPDLHCLIRTLAFDTIYHEHISYWSLIRLQRLAFRIGLKVTATDFLPIHGGSLRVTLQHDHFRSLPWALGDDELGTREPFLTFQARVDEHLQELRDVWVDAALPIWGYGASAKATVMLNALGLLPERIVDDAPSKQGLYVPGVRVPITGPAGLETAHTLVLFSWNWAEDLKARARAAGFAGEFLIPWPEPVLV